MNLVSKAGQKRQNDSGRSSEFFFISQNKEHYKALVDYISLEESIDWRVTLK
jgi:hypothetical protein